MHVCEGVSVYVLQSVNQAVLLLIAAAAIQRFPPLLPDPSLAASRRRTFWRRNVLASSPDQ